jgi:hypothetical protein
MTQDPNPFAYVIEAFKNLGDKYIDALTENAVLAEDIEKMQKESEAFQHKKEAEKEKKRLQKLQEDAKIDALKGNKLMYENYLSIRKYIHNFELDDPPYKKITYMKSIVDKYECLQQKRPDVIDSTVNIGEENTQRLILQAFDKYLVPVDKVFLALRNTDGGMPIVEVTENEKVLAAAKVEPTQSERLNHHIRITNPSTRNAMYIPPLNENKEFPFTAVFNSTLENNFQNMMASLLPILQHTIATEENESTPVTIMTYGQSGSGKTTAAIHLLQDFIKLNPKVTYFTAVQWYAITGGGSSGTLALNQMHDMGQLYLQTTRSKSKSSEELSHTVPHVTKVAEVNDSKFIFTHMDQRPAKPLEAEKLVQFLQNFENYKLTRSTALNLQSSRSVVFFTLYTGTDTSLNAVLSLIDLPGNEERSIVSGVIYTQQKESSAITMLLDYFKDIFKLKQRGGVLTSLQKTLVVNGRSKEEEYVEDLYLKYTTELQKYKQYQKYLKDAAEEALVSAQLKLKRKKPVKKKPVVQPVDMDKILRLPFSVLFKDTTATNKEILAQFYQTKFADLIKEENGSPKWQQLVPVFDKELRSLALNHNLYQDCLLGILNKRGSKLVLLITSYGNVSKTSANVNQIVTTTTDTMKFAADLKASAVINCDVKVTHVEEEQEKEQEKEQEEEQEEEEEAEEEEEEEEEDVGGSRAKIKGQSSAALPLKSARRGRKRVSRKFKLLRKNATRVRKVATRRGAGVFFAGARRRVNSFGDVFLK